MQVSTILLLLWQQSAAKIESKTTRRWANILAVAAATCLDLNTATALLAAVHVLLPATQMPKCVCAHWRYHQTIRQ
jgi:hypothetical protein